MYRNPPLSVIVLESQLDRNYMNLVFEWILAEQTTESITKTKLLSGLSKPSWRDLKDFNPILGRGVIPPPKASWVWH